MLPLILISEISQRKIEISNLLQNIKIKNPHPDLLYFLSGSKLGIEQVRKISDFFSLKPYMSKSRAVVLEEAGNLTIEAQNALLKTLEELPENSLFILAASADSCFLPTVLSRCEVKKLPFAAPNVEAEEIEKILNLNMEKRFEYIEKLQDKKQFLHNLIIFFHQKLRLHPPSASLRASKDVPSNFLFLKKLLQAEEWARQNVNIRAILEYLMLVMPAK